MILAQTTHPSAVGYTLPAPRMPPITRPQWFAAEIRGVTERYGCQTVVNQLDLVVSSGGVYGSLGPNGVGKFTTVKMLLGLAKPTEDEVCVFGRDLRANRTNILPRVSSLTEGPVPYPHPTGTQNLRVVADYLSCGKSSVGAVPDIVGPISIVGKRVHQYSPGMKQRLDITTALISNPELPLLDKPTGGLDPAGVAEIRNLIMRLAHDRGITVMVSSHLLFEIEQMVNIVGITQSGHLRYQGPLPGLRDQGQLVMKVSPVNAAMTHLEASGLRPQSAGDGTILPPLRNDLIAEVVARLVGAGVCVVWTEL